MKHKVQAELVVFQPVSVTITAENPDELVALLHIFGTFDKYDYAEKVSVGQGFSTQKHIALRAPRDLGSIAYRSANYLYTQLLSITEDLAARTKGGVL